MICARQCKTGAGFSRNNSAPPPQSVSLHQCSIVFFTYAAHSSTNDQSLGTFQTAMLFRKSGSIGRVLYSLLHLRCQQQHKRSKPGNLPNSNALSKVGEHWTEILFTYYGLHKGLIYQSVFFSSLPAYFGNYDSWVRIATRARLDD